LSAAPFEPPLATRDHQLAQLLAGMAEQLQKGQKPDVGAVAREHPELGD
jgi:hypothetical protein